MLTRTTGTSPATESRSARLGASGQRASWKPYPTRVPPASTGSTRRRSPTIEAASAALFSGGSLEGADPVVLEQALATARPLVAGGGKSVTDLLVESGLVASRGEARRAVGEGGAYVNNVRVEDPEHVPGAEDFLGGRVLVLRRGKKSFAGVTA